MTIILKLRLFGTLALLPWSAEGTWLCDCDWDQWLPFIHDMLRLFPHGLPKTDPADGSDAYAYLIKLRHETCSNLLVGDEDGFDFFAKLKDAGRVHGHGWDTFGKLRGMCPVGMMTQHLLCSHVFPDQPSTTMVHVESVYWLTRSLAFRMEADGLTMTRHIEPDFPFPQCFQYGSPWRLLFDKLPGASDFDIVDALLDWVQKRRTGEQARFLWRFTPEYKQVGLQDHLERCLPVKHPGCFSGEFTCAACCAGGERGDPQCWAAGYTFEVCCR
eukprot:TRINITY_DN50998_c0_g1_i1.p1 TRINITY_DN50998_c0_g1~~TRINITY_DN50998_c0_g1_i1.p1  ORF type:complete len:272 (-),score=39.38 TRINITY_DN50998_c0_g1_i1:172-987(-)